MRVHDVPNKMYVLASRRATECSCSAASAWMGYVFCTEESSQLYSSIRT